MIKTRSNDGSHIYRDIGPCFSSADHLFAFELATIVVKRSDSDQSGDLFAI